MTQFLTDMNMDNLINAPSVPCDIPPWLKISGFNDYLDNYLTDREKRLALVDAATHPAMGHPEYGKLHGWIFNYMSKIRYIAKNMVPYTFLKYILSMDEK